MPTSRKQKTARKSREQDMLSDIENLDIMLGGKSLDREESVYSTRDLKTTEYGEVFAIMCRYWNLHTRNIFC